MKRTPKIIGDGNIGQMPRRSIPTVGPARVESDTLEIVPAETLAKKDKLEKLAFMEELVTVMVLSTDNPQASRIVPIYNSGVCQNFIRGMKQVVKRKFVESLARAKHTGFKTELQVDQITGNVVNRCIPNTGLLFPFTVVHDPNPRGPAWLEEVAAQPV